MTTQTTVMQFRIREVPHKKHQVLQWVGERSYLVRKDLYKGGDIWEDCQYRQKLETKNEHDFG